MEDIILFFVLLIILISLWYYRSGSSLFKYIFKRSEKLNIKISNISKLPKELDEYRLGYMQDTRILGYIIIGFIVFGMLGWLLP